jgi:hypothetical protein
MTTTLVRPRTAERTALVRRRTVSPIAPERTGP